MKTCITCKHHKRAINISIHSPGFVIPGECLHPNNASLVDGRPRHAPDELRYNRASTSCREEGYWWEAVSIAAGDASK